MTTPDPALTDEMLGEMRERAEKNRANGYVTTALLHPDELDALISAASRTLAAEAEVARLSGKMCLVCGRPEPCTETPEACTFDPSPIEAAQRFHKRTLAAEAEVERLREALKTARNGLAAAMPIVSLSMDKSAPRREAAVLAGLDAIRALGGSND